MALTFPDSIRDWDRRRNLVNFRGEEDGNAMQCAISMEALIDHFGAGKGSKQACLAAFDKWQVPIRQKASDKYAALGRAGIILLRREDFP
jgi:hypothetical protein